MPDYTPDPKNTGDVFTAAEWTEATNEIEEQENYDLYQDSLLDASAYWPVEKLSNGFILPQRILPATSLAMTSQRVQLEYFRAPETANRSTLTKLAGSTPQSGTAPTMIKFGVYSVAGNGDLTKVVQTANDTTLLGSAFVGAAKPLLNPTTGVAQSMAFVKGNWYASATLIITTGVIPTLWGIQTSNTFTANAPRITGGLNSQTDLPATISAASVLGVLGYSFTMFT